VLRLVARPAAWPGGVRRLLDAGAVALIISVALYGAWPLFQAADLATGAGDWHAQAYRVLDLERHGLASWTHDWAGGLPLWSAYQFLPQAVIAGAHLLTGVPETRLMASAQGVLLVSIPVSLFVVLRLSGLRTAAALAGALLVLVLDTRRQPAANFSELWGLALAPPLLWAAYRTSGHRSGYAVAVAVGAAVYVHPLAAATGSLGILAAALVRLPSLTGNAPDAASPSRRWPRAAPASRLAAWAGSVAIQGVLVLGATGFLLAPLVDSARPAYEHPYFASAEFARLLARLAAGSFLPGWPLWLGLAAACAVVVAARGVGERRRAARFLALMALLVAAAALPAMFGRGPHAYRDAQLPRLLSVLPLLTAATVALAVDDALVRLAAVGIGRGRGRRTLIATVALGAAAAALVAVAPARGVAHALGPVSSAAGAATPFSRWLRESPPRPAGARIAAAPEVVADASYTAYGRAWYTGSYSGREWSILAGPLEMFLGGFGAPETGAAYLTALAVDLAVVPAGVRPPLVDPRTGEAAAWQVVARLNGVDVLRLPWSAPYAFTVPAGAVDGLDVPDLPFASVADSYVRDVLVRRFAALAAGSDAVPARVRARSGTTIDIALRELPPGRVLLVSETWDTSWHAEAGGRQLPVRRVGPNLLLVDLAEAPPGVRGDVYLRLAHGLPRSWWLGGLTALGTLAAAAGALRWGPRVGAAEARSRADV
jgi:hypothetical protein